MGEQKPFLPWSSCLDSSQATQEQEGVAISEGRAQIHLLRGQGVQEVEVSSHRGCWGAGAWPSRGSG